MQRTLTSYSIGMNVLCNKDSAMTDLAKPAGMGSHGNAYYSCMGVREDRFDPAFVDRKGAAAVHEKCHKYSKHVHPQIRHATDVEGETAKKVLFKNGRAESTDTFRTRKHHNLYSEHPHFKTQNAEYGSHSGDSALRVRRRAGLPCETSPVKQLIDI